MDALYNVRSKIRRKALPTKNEAKSMQNLAQFQTTSNFDADLRNAFQDWTWFTNNTDLEAK